MEKNNFTNCQIDSTVKLSSDTIAEDFVIIKGNTKIGGQSHIRSHSVIYSGNKIGKKFKTGHGVLIRENNKIGNNVSLGSHSIVEHDVKIGNNCRIHSNVFIPEFSVLEENSWIGPCVVLTNAKYPNNPQTKHKLKGVLIKRGAKIGAGVVILPGITIGENCLVGAGAVVTKNLKKNQVVAGNPAKVLKQITEISDYD